MNQPLPKPPGQHEIDQALASCRDVTAGMWAALFHGLVEKGLTRVEALALVAAYIQKPPDPPPPRDTGF